MKKILFAILLAFLAGNAYAQFGQLDAAGNAKVSRKIVAKREKEKAEKAEAEGTKSGNFYYIHYRASFENSDKGCYGINMDYVGLGNTIYGVSVGMEGNWGIIDPGAYIVSIGPNIGTFLNNGKIPVYMPIKYCASLSDGNTGHSMSITPTIGYRGSKKLNILAGLDFNKSFGDYDDFTVGFIAGVGFTF